MDASLAAQQMATNRTATVRVVAVCKNQVDFRCNLEVADFKKKGEQANFAHRFWYGSASGIPYGSYEAILYFSDACFAIPIVRAIDVFEPDVRLVMDLRPQPRTSAPNTSVTEK